MYLSGFLIHFYAIRPATINFSADPTEYTVNALFFRVTQLRVISGKIYNGSWILLLVSFDASFHCLSAVAKIFLIFENPYILILVPRL